VKKLISVLLLSTIGFSQNCENSILDEILQNENVNQYFQLALSVNAASLDFINDCNTDVNYTMFVPGIDVPTSSAATLLSLDGDLMDYINYYITYNDNIYQELLSAYDGTQGTWSSSILLEMLDNNQAEIYAEMNQYDVDDIMYWNINNVSILTNIQEPICACNGSIFIINDLIWAPGVIDLKEEADLIQLDYNYLEKVLELSKITERGILKIIDMQGRVLLAKEINNTTKINMSTYVSGMYLLDFKSKNQNITKSFLIN
tara:strand:- start:1388 stop:2167 length:780 start_codon:yes stop_codon:yes gene_type:complete